MLLIRFGALISPANIVDGANGGDSGLLSQGFWGVLCVLCIYREIDFSCASIALQLEILGKLLLVNLCIQFVDRNKFAQI